MRGAQILKAAASYAGVLDGERKELVGTWTQGPSSLPLTFRRAAK